MSELDWVERAAVEIARSLFGRRPRGDGWKAKIWQAACDGAVLGIQRASGIRISELGSDPHVTARARRAAIDVLMSRLPRAEWSAREKLRSRIALIRSGNGDELPEVQAVILALEESEGAQS